jgi:choline dehydrogenase
MKIVQFKMIPLFFALSVAWVPYSEAKIKRALVQEPCNQLFDVIIVGAGTAGCVLANRLTEDPTFNVLLIDAGRDDSRLDPILPVDLPDPLPNKANNPWPSFIPLALSGIGNLDAQGFDKWQHVPLLRDDPTSRQIWYPRGAGWGGCTIHNAGVALRGHSDVYDQWDVLVGSPGIWNYNSLIPYFIKMENRGQHRAPFDATSPGGLYFDPTQPANTVGDFDPTTQGIGGPVTLAWFTFPDIFQNALNIAATSGGPYGTYPGSPIPILVDADNQSNSQYLTPQPLTDYDQFGSDFSSLNPYGPTAPPAAFPPNFGPLSNVAVRFQRGQAAGYYLYPILPGGRTPRPNITVISEALVTKIIFDNQKNAIGVQYLQNDVGTPIGSYNIYQTGRQMNTSRAGIGATPTDAAANAKVALANGPKVARATKEVILCGGTFNSPQILMLSGIGPAADLQALGIPVISDLQGVGQNYQDHPETDIVWQHDFPYDFFADIADGQEPQGGLNTLLFKSDVSQPLGNAVVHFSPGGVPVGWSAIGDVLDAFQGNARYDGPPQYIYPFNTTNQDGTNFNQRYDPPLSLVNHSYAQLDIRAGLVSRGFVKLRSADPTDRLYIVTNLLNDPADMQLYVNAFRDTVVPFIQNLGAQTPSFFDSWVAPGVTDFLTSGTVLLPDKSNFNQAGFESWVLGHLWAHHASGTCKMGESSDPMAVVDGRLHVYGVQRVRVVDCSVFPVIPSANTQIPAYVTAERAADLIKQDLPLVTPITSINPLVDTLLTTYGN